MADNVRDQLALEGYVDSVHLQARSKSSYKPDQRFSAEQQIRSRGQGSILQKDSDIAAFWHVRYWDGVAAAVLHLKFTLPTLDLVNPSSSRVLCDRGSINVRSTTW